MYFDSEFLQNLYEKPSAVHTVHRIHMQGIDLLANTT